MTASGAPAAGLAQQLQENLQAQQQCAQELLGLLQAEREALIHSDVARLESVTRDKSEAANVLQRLGNSLTQLRNAARAPSMDGWLASLRNGLPALWSELLALAAKCQAANQDNAVLLGTREAQLKQTLRAFRPAGAPEIYGRSGYAALGIAPRQLGSA
ncbi:flagella synthesis protein FlgN [Solimonas marina]|uniref:Flagellar protein FlgN n=1 Tax=Solimonas marina TaxID=2714601 RepID=A0A969W7C1_9GAMM|nr:flagellar protein FlgN [Solimonas marina]NKF21747.1 flagellar protein FlgN [Solimonas marina]